MEYNIAKALTCLGNQVNFLSMIGKDQAAQLVRVALEEDNLSSDYVLDLMQKTPQSVILYDPSGKRQVHVDLKDIQEQV